MTLTAKTTEVLIIDDDATDRMAIRRCLSRPKFSIAVHEATTGEEGAALLAARSFDCIFLDYRLPDMDGVSFLKRFYNSDAGLMPCPIVMLTGQGSEGVMIDALHWGANDYIVKDNITTDTIMIALIKAREIFDLRKSRIIADDKLRHAQKMDAVGQLTSGIAHDFNNLLTVILGNTHIIRRKLEKLEGQEVSTLLSPKIEAIDAAARRGADLVSHLMIFTRQRELNQDIIDPNACIAVTIELLKRTLGERIEVREDFAADIWHLCVDASQLENAIINIALNARDSMPQGGTLEMKTRNAAISVDDAQLHPHMAPGEYVVISITDTGTGMPENVRKHIFEPFFTTKPPGEGTGLGLSMVYGFTKQSNGYIHADSTPGEGTSFHIYLPREVAAAQEQKKEATHE